MRDVHVGCRHGCSCSDNGNVAGAVGVELKRASVEEEEEEGGCDGGVPERWV
jgi:hypothetical protein